MGSELVAVPDFSARRAEPCLNSTWEHGEQAQRSDGGPMVCLDHQLVRKAG